MFTSRPIGLDALGLDAASPFHCVISTNNEIIQVGRSLRRLLPHLTLGATLDSVVEVQAPPGPAAYEHLIAQQGRLVVLVLPNADSLTLRAQVIPSGSDYLILVGTPWFTEMSHIGACGLSLSDFAPHESVTDLLLLMQTQSSALTDAMNMGDALAALNHELEARVKQRTIDLEEKTNALQQEITDKQRIEAELRLAQKLESVGQLAAGIAHEINTPIQFIGDNLRFIGESAKEIIFACNQTVHIIKNKEYIISKENCELINKADIPYLTEEIPKAIEQSLEGIERVASLVKALKEFSHPDSGEHKPADINHAIRNALIVAKNEYKYIAEIDLRLDQELPPTDCNISEINQVLLNLIINAAHAIEEKKISKQNGKIIIATTKRDNYTEITIQDNGTGIPEHARQKVFDPFFTTKPIGKGTGQGLYLAHSIITKKHKGSISYVTEMNVGTTFIIHLPIEEKQTPYERKNPHPIR